MDGIKMQIPVYLPGSNRDWTEHSGVATITPEGELTVRFDNPKSAEILVDMAKAGTLMACSFDYKQSDEVLKEINERYNRNLEVKAIINTTIVEPNNTASSTTSSTTPRTAPIDYTNIKE